MFVTTRKYPLCAALLMTMLVSCAENARAAVYGIGECTTPYTQCLANWKVSRVSLLTGADGYLNLAGLYWLKSGINTFGSSTNNDLVFPPQSPGRIGSFELANGNVFMFVQPDVAVQTDAGIIERTRMIDDQGGPATIARLGALAWTLIRRDDRFAIRLRDFAHPELSEFAPIEYFATDESLRINARLDRYERPRIVRVDTVVEGLDYNPSSPGKLRFELAGRQFELEAYNAGDELLIVFGDQTSGKDTYPAGRFLYADKPGPDEITVLDFNTAQNPPCAFNEFATCPIAAPQNRLRIRIEAGEIYRPSRH